VSALVRAAGCLVWRSGRSDKGGKIEVLVVHRPRYDDWSFPKGKVDPGETDLECAIREVEEESGFSGAIGAELEAVSYVDHKGRDKVVRYWVMEVGAGEFVENDEVDEVRWLAPDDASGLLSYEHDVALLRQFRSVSPPH